MQKGANFTIVLTTLLAPVVQMVDNTIYRINLYPLDSAIGFPNTYPLDSDLSSGKCYPSFEQLGSDWFKHQIFTKSWQSSKYINPLFSNQLLYNKILSESK